VNLSRAGFLKICAAVLLGRPAAASSFAAFSGVPAAAEAAPSGVPFRVEDARASMFRPHLHTTFSVQSAIGASLPLVLSQVLERPVTHRVEQFSLSFDACGGARLPHGTHAFHHPVLGAFDLFVAPVGGGSAHRTTYEACFSRHRGAQALPAGSRSEPAAPGGARD
jgi:hypothetical protein